MRFVATILVLSGVLLTGCQPLENALANVNGLNLSACGQSLAALGLCYQLYQDNQGLLP